MKTRLAPLLVIQTLFADPAIAEPCVGAAYDIPFPGAVGVSMHHADVPASQFPGVWQDGMIDGQFYQIFANRLAVLKAERTTPAWSINVNCQQKPCTILVAGNPPEAALTTSKKLEQCLVPPEAKTAASPDAKKAPEAKAPSKPAPDKAAPKASTSEKVVPAKPAPAKPAPEGKAKGTANPGPEQKLPAKADAAARPVTDAETSIANAPLAAKSGSAPLKPTAPDAEKPAPPGQPTASTGNPATKMTCTPPQNETTPIVAVTCRSAVIPGGDPVSTLQKLLVMAGADPGGVDGLYGGKTKKAVLEVLGYRGRNLDVSEAIGAVDAFLCDQEN